MFEIPQEKSKNSKLIAASSKGTALFHFELKSPFFLTLLKFYFSVLELEYKLSRNIKWNLEFQNWLKCPDVKF